MYASIKCKRCVFKQVRSLPCHPRQRPFRKPHMVGHETMMNPRDPKS